MLCPIWGFRYTPSTPAAAASHKHLHHWVFLVDQSINDYEEDNAEYGTKSIGHIHASLPASQTGLEEIPAGAKTFSPMVMTPHMHAPSAIRQEYWNADTDQIICNATADYGDEKNGDVKSIFNEASYVAIPPCIFGFQPGLEFPKNMSFGTVASTLFEPLSRAFHRSAPRCIRRVRALCSAW